MFCYCSVWTQSCCLPSCPAVQRAVTAVVVVAAVAVEAVPPATVSTCCATVSRCPSTRYRSARSLETQVSDTPSGRSHTVDWTTAIGLAKPSTNSSGTGMKVVSHWRRQLWGTGAPVPLDFRLIFQATLDPYELLTFDSIFLYVNLELSSSFRGPARTKSQRHHCCQLLLVTLLGLLRVACKHLISLYNNCR